MVEWWILLGGQIITAFGLGGVLIWMGKAIRAMKDTVGAQKATISAQSARMDSMETFLKTMETVLKSTDEQTMLARLEAHKKFVEHEKDVSEKRLTAQFEEEKAKVLQGSQQALEQALEAFATTVNALVEFATNSLPYVPKERRTEFISTLDLDPRHLPRLKSILADIARTAPDLTAPIITFGSSLPSLAGSAPTMTFGSSLLSSLAGSVPTVTFGTGLSSLAGSAPIGSGLGLSAGLPPPPLARERCKFGHAHPPTQVVAATENPTQPSGPRPYHCPDCSEVSKYGTVPGHWREYPDPIFARLAGHDSACRVCFPE